MELLTIFLTALVAFLGLPIGFFLAKIAKEELKAGKRYFQILQNTFYALAILAFIYSLKLPIKSFIVIVVIAAYLSIKFNPKAMISYFIFIPLFLISSKNTDLFLFINSMIFLYGLPTGALMIERGFINYVKEEFENPVSTGYLSKKIRKVRYAVWVIMLEIISFPTFFMKNKNSALYHLKFVCPICPSSRKRHRDVKGNSTCWWEYSWRKGNYNIPKHFGMKNWIKQYTSKGTNLKEFKNR